MNANQPTTELIPKDSLPASGSKGKKVLRTALWSFLGIIVLAAAFFLLFVRSRPAPLDELRSLGDSSAPVRQSAAQQKATVDLLEQQSAAPVSADGEQSALQQLSK